MQPLRPRPEVPPSAAWVWTRCCRRPSRRRCCWPGGAAHAVPTTHRKSGLGLHQCSWTTKTLPPLHQHEHRPVARRRQAVPSPLNKVSFCCHSSGSHSIKGLLPCLGAQVPFPRLCHDHQLHVLRRRAMEGTARPPAHEDRAWLRGGHHRWDCERGWGQCASLAVLPLRCLGS